MRDRVLRADALVDIVLGLVLLLAPWDGLYRTLDLPRPEPELFAQLAGALLVAFAYLLWLAPRDETLTLVVAAAAALANATAVVLVGGWLVAGDLDVGGRGTTLLASVAVLVALFAALEAAIASRRIAILLPPD